MICSTASRSIPSATTCRRREKAASVEIEFIFDPIFTLPDAAKRLLGPPPATQKRERRRPPIGTPSYLAFLWSVSLLNRAEEVYYFRRMNFLKYLAAERQAAASAGKLKGRGKNKAFDQVATWLEESQRIRNQITEANLRLVVSLAKQYSQARFQEFEELIAQGNITLIRAIERFDVGKGYRFSTYGYLSVQRTMFAVIQKMHRQQSVFQTDGHDLVNGSVLDAAMGAKVEQRVVECQGVASKLLQRLDPRELKVVRARYGLSDVHEPRTFQSIGDELGVSKERARQLVCKAIEKLRAAADQNGVEVDFDAC